MTQERSQASLSILQQKVEDFFLQTRAKNQEGNLWFADCPSLSKSTEAVTDVILFGSFLRRILESGNWPFSEVRLWCLSPSVKQVLNGLFGLRDDEVAVIPREELFPQSAIIKPFPDLNKPWTLVFSGRLSPTKNLETFLVVGYFLQKFFSPELRLVLQGEFQDDLDPLCDRLRGDNYQSYIKSIVSSLDWTHVPQFLSAAKNNPWYQDHKLNPVFASFSLFSAEDFGVSVAEARMQGWPVILSDWGGQRDVQGDSVIKCSAHAIPEAWEGLQSLLVKGEYLARLIASRWSDQNSLKITSCLSSSAPSILSVSRLHECRQFFIKKLDQNFADLYAGEGKIENFFKTESGKKIYAHYRHLFAAPLGPRPHLLIVTHDMEPQAGAVVALVPKLVQGWLNYALQENLEVDFLFVRDMMKRLRFYRSHELHSLVFPFFVNSLLPLVQFLTRDLALHCPLIAFYNEKQDGIHEDLILKNFRKQDAYVVANEQSVEQIPLGQNPVLHLEELTKIQKSEFFSVVEIEINSECNRRCSYCPNSFLSRKSSKMMTAELFQNLLAQLSDLSFEGILSFHFYNEPLLHPQLVQWVELASKTLPKARIYLYSNGTLLTQEIFEALVKAGMQSITVTRHEGLNSLPVDQWKNNLSAELLTHLILQNHQEVQKTNRGGLLNLGLMTPPKLSCYMPSSMIVVTSEGNVLPCYEDYEEKLSLGNIQTTSLRQIWNSVQAKNLREKLAQGQRGDFEPCKCCNNSRIFPIR